MKPVVCFIVAFSCSTTAFAGKPVTMFVPTIQELTATPLIDGGASAESVDFQENGSSGCAVNSPPGTKGYSVWYEGNVDAAGKLRFDAR